MSTNGQSVSAFERAFADYVGARFAIAMANGTATLQTALMALGVRPGDRVATTPLTMAATSIAILNCGAVPIFRDVDPDTWLARISPDYRNGERALANLRVNVSLYGLHYPSMGLSSDRCVDDAAQTLRPHGEAAFTSYSFQASKILALGEGGMLVTDHESLAIAAREISSLGYRMRADQSRIDSRVIRDPSYARHHRYPAINARMNDVTAQMGLGKFDSGISLTRVGGGVVEKLPSSVEIALATRQKSAAFYRDAIAGCDWITPQHVPEGWTHDYWSYAVALADATLWHPFADAIERHGGERPYAAWRLSYDEPALRPLVLQTSGDRDGVTGFPVCPVAESLQPRIVAFQTNNLTSAERNAEAVRKAIREIGG